MTTATLPPIERWWPHLSVGARHALLIDLGDPIGPEVRAEIGLITGRAIPAGTRLDDGEIAFIRTQQEPVD